MQRKFARVGRPGWRHRSLWLAAAGALAPAIAAADPTLPTIPAGTFTVAPATGNATTDTASLKAQITAAKTAGGGTVIVPAGTYLSNTLTLSSGINLQLSAGATIQDATSATLITTSGNTSNVEISGSGTLDGHAITTSGNNLVVLNHVTNLAITGVTIANSSHEHLVVETDTNVTIDSININDNFSKANPTTHTYLANTDGIDFSGSHFLIKNSSIDDGDDDIVAKPSGVQVTDVKITADPGKQMLIGNGHGISVGGQTPSGLDGMTVSNITFNGTDNGLRLKAGSNAINPGGGGIVKNVSFSNITMTNVDHPIIINSWYDGGDDYGHNELSASSFHNVTNPGDPSVSVSEGNNTALYPFFDNISYSNITATGGQENVAIIYGLNSTDTDPTNLTKNIDSVSFSNVNLTGKWGADIYYTSNLDISGLTVHNTSGNAFNLFGNTTVPEPAAVGVMMAMGLTGLSRRRARR